MNVARSLRAIYIRKVFDKLIKLVSIFITKEKIEHPIFLSFYRESEIKIRLNVLNLYYLPMQMFKHVL